MTAETVAEPTPWDGLWFKALRKGRRATHAPEFVWPEPGIWLEVAPGSLVACQHGLHVATLPQILAEWLNEELWLVEPVLTGALLDHENTKSVVRRARLVRKLPWDERSARLFAADCAERVLPIFEREWPGDDRPRLAIEAARAYARGEIGDAARDAAWAAAWDAARDAARAAAGAAARDAAWAAAWDAARDAARAAAGAAARDAAWAAAGAAARAAAGDAARDAAGAAAGAAARAAERDWQARHLATMLGLGGQP